MANDITMNPLIIDTAGASVLIARPIHITRIRAVGLTTAGHTAVIQDGNARVVWATCAPTTNHTEESDMDLWVTGLIVSTLASGKLYIYYE
jgi:sugar (pentulose or hexulose) kinase